MTARELRNAVSWVVLAIVVMVALSLGLTAWRYNTAEMHGKVDAQVQIESAPSRIANYDHFFDLCASIQGYEAGIAAQREVLAAVTGEDAQRVRAVITGITAQRGRAIAQYNVDARKEYTSARFLDAGLPKQISDSATGSTQCVN